MKTIYFTLLALLLAGCSSMQAEDPPIVQQSHDLLDSDGDGVINARDYCVQTPKGVVIDNTGCPIASVQSEQNKLHILFPNDVDQVPRAFLKQIQSMSDFLAKYPSTYITLKGYASPVGKEDYNLALSERRSVNVRKALIDAGVAPDRIQTISFGENEPVQASDKNVVNTLSRRVTATVLGMNTDIKENWTIFDQRAE
ncbi:OmpA family protein [Vibrio rumoiensis]|uniref:OmpA-like domain-containing protein n=1 Tax=Vibrio rumoiensis 1S-45 TaxID=1188252 RepID=A0A1E5DZK6_9VIBR|nr:OmpA family protein [Vibrio rumoiensis]OEF23303.1 hypothetical protein A1QC_12450 [Vibrio rumoiensis 1S-45]